MCAEQYSVLACWVIKKRIMDNVRITVFADPVCTWCWGSVPVLRAVEYRFGNQVEVKYVMGGMIEDVVSFMEHRGSPGGNIALLNRNIHAGWIEASEKHGMPVATGGFHLFSNERRSSVPQNLAYIASEMYAQRGGRTVKPDMPCHFLRVLQENTAVDAAVTNDTEVLVGLAAMVGMDTAIFRELLAGNEVKERYKVAKKMCARYEVNSFPTFLLEYRGEEKIIRGYIPWDQMQRSIVQLSKGTVTLCADGREQPTAVNVEKFIAKHSTAYPVEVATAFSLERREGHPALYSESYVGLSDIMAGLVENGNVAMVPKGNGFMFYALKNGATVSQIRGRERAGVL